MHVFVVANQAPEPPVEKEDGGSSAKSGSAAKSGRAAAKSGGAAAANGGSKSGARGKSGAKMEGEGTTTGKQVFMSITVRRLSQDPSRLSFGQVVA